MSTCWVASAVCCVAAGAVQALNATTTSKLKVKNRFIPIPPNYHYLVGFIEHTAFFTDIVDTLYHVLSHQILIALGNQIGRRYPLTL
jgi:hypothetical protein